MPDPARQSTAASPGALLLLMALTALGQLATNVVVPSLGEIGRSVGLAAESTGLILSMVLLGLAVGQLVVGPLSDRVGRRPVMLAGLVIYLLGSIAATFAPNGFLLLAARAMQGFGASAGLALPRAIARDRYHGPIFLRVMSALTMAMAVTPGLAPIFGGAVSGHWGWRASLALSVVAGAAMLVAAWFALEESHHERARNGGIAAVLGGYRRVLRNRTFLAYALSSGAVIGGAYSEVAGAQRFYVGEFGWSAAAMSAVPALYAGGFLIGGLLGGRIDGQRRMELGYFLILLAPVALLALNGTGFMAALAMTGLVVMSQMGVGLMMPAAIGHALIAVEGAAGTASAVMGAVHMVGGASGAALVAALPLPASWSIPLVMLGFGLLGAAIQRLAARRA
ncbi:MFS transporter [Acetobacteraceae bacterium H6797]|nr:MFS transporter [Acetobacteraceae bacterium H6797]